MNICVEKHVTHTRAYGSQHNSMVVQIHRSVDSDLHGVVSGQSVLDDSSFNVSRFIPSHDVLLLYWIDTTPSGNSLSVAAFDEF